MATVVINNNKKKPTEIQNGDPSSPQKLSIITLIVFNFEIYLCFGIYVSKHGNYPERCLSIFGKYSFLLKKMA